MRITVLRITVFLVLALGCVAPPLPATAKNDLFPATAARQLDAQLAAIMRKENLPSVAVAVEVAGKGRYTFAGGFADLQKRTPRFLDQPFRIGSVTKPFAAIAILKLVERGLLRKSDTISRWYPRFPNARLITIDDLLRMRSGIPAPNDDEVLAKVYDAPLAAAPSLEAELASYARLRRQFKTPNTSGAYTDFNYDVLAGIARRVSGKEIADLMRESVIAPLGLRSTWYPRTAAIPSALRGYGWNRKTRRFDDKTLFNAPLAGAAGALVSNVGDLLIFSRALCQGTLLQPPIYRAQLSGQPLQGTQTNYGEGVAVGSGVCGHSGTINGFNTDMYYFSQLHASLVVSVNRLDRDNRAQTTPILGLMTKTIRRYIKPT